jgi:aromatic-L-amino-acid decarboxylase
VTLPLTDRLDPAPETMDCIWRAITARMAAYQRDVPGLPVAPKIRLPELLQSIHSMQCKGEMAWQDVVEWVDRHMRADQLHTSHPCYFGLFNPAPLPLGIVADALVAAYNPQLAAWSHSPFAVELERHLIRMFGERFDYPANSTDGTFCSGGAEANLTVELWVRSRDPWSKQLHELVGREVRIPNDGA